MEESETCTGNWRLGYRIQVICLNCCVEPRAVEGGETEKRKELNSELLKILKETFFLKIFA